MVFNVFGTVFSSGNELNMLKLTAAQKTVNIK